MLVNRVLALVILNLHAWNFLIAKVGFHSSVGCERKGEDIDAKGGCSPLSYRKSERNSTMVLGHSWLLGAVLELLERPRDCHKSRRHTDVLSHTNGAKSMAKDILNHTTCACCYSALRSKTVVSSDYNNRLLVCLIHTLVYVGQKRIPLQSFSATLKNIKKIH